VKGKKEKKRPKEIPTSDRKMRNGIEQDHLKKTSLEPLRQGQRLDTSETKLWSSKEHKPPKHKRAPPAHMHTPPEQVPTLGTKLVRPVPKTGQTSSTKPVKLVTKIGQTDFVQQTTTPTSQKCKRNAQAPP
jgi:hypothetical protein